MLGYLRDYFVLAEARKKAVIITGNPRHIKSAHAKAFYGQLADHVRSLGYDVSFDPGKPMTSPDESAHVWIGHSRGADRLRFAPKHVKAVAVGYPKHKIENGKTHSLHHKFPVVNHPQDNAHTFNKDKPEAPNQFHFTLDEGMKEQLRKHLS